MAERFFNIWYVPKSRWTTSLKQDPKNPTKMTWENAHKEAIYYFGKSLVDVEIREILADGTPGLIFAYDPGSTVTNDAKAVNDYICPFCKNDRVSKTEKNCWRCGNTFSLER